MLKMNYQNEYTQYDIEFTKNSDNVVTLKGSFPVKTDGFYLNREGHADMWDYTEYKTIYKQTVDWILDAVKEETAIQIIKSINGVVIRKSANRGSVTPR